MVGNANSPGQAPQVGSSAPMFATVLGSKTCYWFACRQAIGWHILSLRGAHDSQMVATEGLRFTSPEQPAIRPFCARRSKLACPRWNTTLNNAVRLGACHKVGASQRLQNPRPFLPGASNLEGGILAPEITFENGSIWESPVE